MSRDICRKILSTFNLNTIHTIASYCAVANEVNLNSLLLTRPKLYLPVTKPNNLMQFAQFDSIQNLVINKFGILEPINTKVILANKIIICFVPLVAFNRQGARLGMGGGYYDRYFEYNELNKIPTKLVGVAYDFQENDTIQAESWDVPLDMIITNKEVITP